MLNQTLKGIKMKKGIYLALALIASLASGKAYAYSSPVSPDPKNGEGNIEYKYIVKAQVAGESGAIAKGDLLTYASAYDGYTVTNMQGNNNGSSQLALACIAAEPIASGDLGYHKCVTRGYIDYLSYVGGMAGFSVFDSLCVTASADAAPCSQPPGASAGNTSYSGTATAAVGRIKALQTKAAGTSGTNLKAIINIP